MPVHAKSLASAKHGLEKLQSRVSHHVERFALAANSQLCPVIEPYRVSYVMQAAWVHFAETGPYPLLCMLQSSVLTIYTLSGELHSVPLACKYTQMWPLPRGIILAVSLMGASSVMQCQACTANI